MSSSRAQACAAATTPPGPWLETLRLDLRDLVAADYPVLRALDSDPRVMRYIGDGKPRPEAATAAMLARYLRYPERNAGLGVWLASRRDTGACVGLFALVYAGGSTDIEVGYRLLPRAWGHGFATEGARALVAYAFDDLGLDRVIGITHRDNAASQRVLLKAGLADRGWGRYYGRRVRLFVGENPQR
jgi:[ribosomal protein S5]-alanine N-acetyltransferase